MLCKVSYILTPTTLPTPETPIGSMTDNSDNSEVLLDAVYDLALDPNSLEKFTQAWEQFLQSHNLAEENEQELQASLEKHFDRAFRLLEKIGRTRKTDNKSLQEFVEHRSSPSIALNHEGKVLAINAEAMTLFGADAETPNVRDIVHIDSSASLGQGLEQLASVGAPRPILVLLRNRLPALMLLQHMEGTDIIIADVSGSSWDQRVTVTLRAMYGLTARECEVASWLYQGLTIKQVAAQQNRSLETVRKHTKALLTKTETHSQPKLMRLLTSLNFAHAGDHVPVWMNTQCANHTIKLRDGRKLAYYDAGKKTGKTMVVLHGIMHDPELPPNIHKLLIDKGYRIIGMSRAWFGESSPPINPSNILEDAASDLNQLLDSLDINKVSLLACMAGSIHAYVFTALYPKRVQRIINLAGMVPIEGDAQIDSMPRGFRAVAHTARYFPKLFPTLIRTGVALIDGGNIRKLFNTGYRNSPVDFAATQDPKIFKRLSTGYRFAVYHGYSAYTYEGIAIMQDRSKYLDKVKCPINYINGSKDGLTSMQSVKQFCQKHSNAKVSEIEEGAHLLIYTHSKLVEKELELLISG